MSMLTLTGTITNIYESPKGVNKTTGESYGGQERIQLLCENILQNGSKRVELIDLSVPDISPYKEALGKPVRVPVGVYVKAGKATFYSMNTAK